MDAVVPARIVERLCFFAIRASLRLWRLVSGGNTTDTARQHHANLRLRYRASRSIAKAINPAQRRPPPRQSPVARTRFKTLIYLKRFGVEACGALVSTSKFLAQKTKPTTWAERLRDVRPYSLSSVGAERERPNSLRSRSANLPRPLMVGAFSVPLHFFGQPAKCDAAHTSFRLAPLTSGMATLARQGGHHGTKTRTS